MTYTRLTLEHHAALLSYIVAQTRKYGCPPSQRQIAGWLGLTLTAAHVRVKRLEQKGYITRASGRRARCIRVTVRGRILMAKYRVEAGEAL